ncbi:glycosyltransferase family 2 protein [Saccharomonospora sp. NPDC046836]|uniref:glycosyltransferase family 2 protein n=1 Tax=Saccharomonospora sp. NPDC046836 TaxID=3156921 RepID=UPI003401C7C6
MGGFSAFESISLVLVVMFLSYMVSIMVPFLRRKPTRPGNPDDYGWHAFIPCRDEAAVIEGTLTRLRRDFPQCHVWVVDDDSDDETADIVLRCAASDPMVHLVQRRRPEARTGKGDALNAAYVELNRFLPADVDRSRIIVFVLDADGVMAPNALVQVAGPECFGDPEVGAAQIAVWMDNRDDPNPRPGDGRLVNFGASYLVRMQDLEFRTTIAAMQHLRERTGSVGLGGNGQFTRLSVLDEIAEKFHSPWHGSLLEDYELGLHVLLSGHRNRYVHETYVAQEGLPRLRRLLTQRTRWAQGNMQCVRYVPQVVRSKYFSNSGVIEACYYLVLPYLQFVGVLVWPVALSLLAADVVNTNGSFADQWWFFLMLFLFGIAPFAMWGPIYRKQCCPEAPWWKGVLWGFGFWLYVYYTYAVTTRAVVRLIRGRAGWAKTRRNAEIAVGPTAKEA